MNACVSPTERLNTLATQLHELGAALGCVLLRGFGEFTLLVPSERILAVGQRLRDEETFQFTQLIDLCGVDYSTYGHSEWATLTASNTGFGRGVQRIFTDQINKNQEHPQRFAVVYHLLSLAHNLRIRLRVYLPENALTIDSVCNVWPSANWFEREAFDLFGIVFNGHPDLRRILTDYEFVGHPLRKDFPLSGHVEMRYDPVQQRVIYEPVKIPPRTLVPRVIRSDNRYLRDGVTPSSAPPSKP